MSEQSSNINQSQKWEYALEYISLKNNKWVMPRVIEGGKEGWEAVGITYDNSINMMYVLLKRPLIDRT